MSVGGPVNYSVRIRHDWQCRRCGEDVQDDTYMVVDALARPDLVQGVIKGKVPSVTCPSCGARKARFFPLLVYRGEATGQLVYFYPPHTPPEQDEANRKLYVEALLDRLGPVSAEEAENSGVLSVPFDAARGVLAPTARGASAGGGPRRCRVKPRRSAPPPEVLRIGAELVASGRAGLGRSLSDRPLAQELARLAERALELLGDRDQPELRGDLEMTLGMMLSSANRGQDVIGLERAIGLLLRRARSISREEDPQGWAIVRYELARAYGQRYTGDVHANQELAIRHLRAALEETEPERNTGTWARVRSELAKVLIDQGTQSAPGQIEEAIGLLEPVVARLDPARDKELWCDAQSFLAGAYNVRLQGDPAVNREHVVRLYEQLDAVESEEADPEQWANTQARLAVSLSKRMRGDSRENSLRAREHLLRALAVYERVGDRGEASSTYDKLAVVAGDLGEYDEEIRCHEAALVNRHRDTAPHLWARSMSKLGWALLEQAERDETENVAARARRGLGHIEDAVAAYEGLPTGFEVGFQLVSLARACRLCRKLDPSREDELRERELSVLREAMDRAYGHSDLLRTAAEQLGDALAERTEWSAAADAYQQAVEADEQRFRACLVSSSRELQLNSAGDLHQRAAYALARAGRLDEALLCLERGRTRNFSLALSPDHDQLHRLAQTDPETHTAYVRAAETLQTLEARNRELSRQGAPRDGGRELEAAEYELGGDLDEARAELAAALARVRALPGMDSFLRETTRADILGAALPGEPLCYIAATKNGSLSLIVRHESDPGPRVEAVESTMTAADARALADAFAATVAEKGGELRELLPRLGEELIGPVAVALGTATGVVVIACGPTAHLPLHAAHLPSTGEPLLATCAVAYAPSVRLLLAARHRAAAPLSEPLLVTASTPGQDGGLLAAQEVETLRRLFAAVGESRDVTGDPPGAEDGCTKGDLVDALSGGSHVHLACHGAYDPTDPLASRLDLGGERITLADLLNSRPRPLERARLVTLSACDTGLVDPRLPDEAIGLPTGILLAGGAGVVCTRWRTNDTAAVLLMIAFYRRLLGHGVEPPPNGTPPGVAESPAQALRWAQLWLRSATVPELLGLDWLPAEIRRRLTSRRVPARPFRHPFLWAPFSMVGA
ncbi:CHAT domain-containing protein [Streptomyces sp. NPDC008240]|uniref:CHAT domain-containing protein n=1 Tax=Streptomyces sp. NPDC008240 TaxID=3364822 RepID=UPI0036EFD905